MLDEALSNAVAVRSAVFYPLLQCNARCPFCSTRVYTPTGIVSTTDHLEGRDDRSIHEYALDIEVAKERYRALRAQGVQSVNIQGGEPTLYEPLAELIRFGRELGFAEQIVVTNGLRLADWETASTLYHSGVSTIALSIFGAEASVHDESLGHPGSFSSLVEGVRNLIRLRERSPRTCHITGQIILHARNYSLLEHIIAFWRLAGIDYFSIRLLRSTPNVPDGRDWFFDLAKLAPHLERTLDTAARSGDVTICIPEIFYCLLGTDFLGFVVGDLAANQRLQTWSRIESKHSVSIHHDMKQRHLAVAPTTSSECARCRLNTLCAKIERPYDALTTATVRALDPPLVVEGLVQKELTGARFWRMSKLLAESDALVRLGAPRRLVGTLQSRLLSHAATTPEIPARFVLKTPDAVPRLMDALSAEHGQTIVRYVASSRWGIRDELPDSAEAILGAAELHSPDALREVAFVRRCRPLLVEPTFAVFAGELPPSTGPRRPFAVCVYLDDQVTERELSILFDRVGSRNPAADRIARGFGPATP